MINQLFFDQVNYQFTKITNQFWEDTGLLKGLEENNKNIVADLFNQGFMLIKTKPELATKEIKDIFLAAIRRAFHQKGSDINVNGLLNLFYKSLDTYPKDAVITNESDPEAEWVKNVVDSF